MDSMSDYESVSMEQVKQEITKHGLSKLNEFFKSKLEGWQDVEVNIAITGKSGTGKSSFINAIRGHSQRRTQNPSKSLLRQKDDNTQQIRLRDDDFKDGAAKVGVTQCTKEPRAYVHPKNPKIKFWDLQGIGTPDYPDLETYCKQVELEKYHIFLIFTASRFEEYDLKLAKKIREINKRFFFIRTKIDENIRAEKRKRSFNEDVTLEEIRCDCSKNLYDLLSNEQDIFLISNHYPAKWDFARLTQAILDVLPTYQRESLTLSLGVLTSLSTEILKRKVEVLKGRIWMVAAASAAVAVVPVPVVSLAADITLILQEVSFYRSQLGLPEEGSEEFLRLHVFTQEQIGKHCLTTVSQISTLLAPYANQTAIEEGARFIPVIGSVLASCFSFGATYVALKQHLQNLEQTALLVMKEAAQKSLAEMD